MRDDDVLPFLRACSATLAHTLVSLVMGNYSTAHLAGTAQGVGAVETQRHGDSAALKVRGQRPA